MRQHTESGSEDSYRYFFDHAAVSLWVQDISELRKILVDWKAKGVGDLRSFLRENPSNFRKAVHAIRVVEVNEATLKLYGVEERKELLGPLDSTLDLEDTQVVENLLDDILAIAEGQEHVTRESSAITPSGKRIDIQITSYIPTEHSTHHHMLVNVIDITERKQMEKQLERERLLHHLLIDNLPDAVYLKDREHRFVLANQATADLMKAGDPANLIGRTDREFYPEQMADEFVSEERQVLEQGQPMVNESDSRSDSSGTRWILSTKVPIRDVQGEITGLVGIATDITAHKHAEQTLLANEAQYHEIVSHAPIGIIRCTVEGWLFDANPAFARSLGYETSQELLQDFKTTSIATLFIDATLRSALSDPKLIGAQWLHAESRYLRKDGSFGVGRVIFRSFSTANPSEVVLEGFLEDITEQEQANEALARERVLMNILMDSVPDMIYFKDLQSRFTLVNKAKITDCGVSDLQNVLGKTDADFYTADHAHELYESEQEIIRSGKPIVEIEERVRRPDSPDRWLSTTKLPLRDQAGTIVGTFGISRDITERKALQTQTIRAQRLESLAQLSAGIAHQFNNINLVILGYLGLIAQNPEFPLGLRSNLEKALSGVKRAAEITKKLEIFSDTSSLQREHLRLAEVVPQLLGELEEEVRSEAVSIRLDLRGTSAVQLNRSTLSFLLSSLISNSLHALQDRPAREIAVSTRELPEFSCLEVTDTGCGIPEGNMVKIFTPFFTTKGEWATPGDAQMKVRGLGLSLAVCRSLVSESGGKIEIESRVGVGTTVRVLFRPAESGPRRVPT